MGMKKGLGQKLSEVVERIGRERGDPSIERERVLFKAWTARIRTFFVVPGRCSVDERIMKHDSVTLLVMLPSAELVKDLQCGCCLVAEDPECVPSIFAALTLFANDDGSHIIGRDAHVDVS